MPGSKLTKWAFTPQRNIVFGKEVIASPATDILVNLLASALFLSPLGVLLFWLGHRVGWLLFN
jgi:hypothetical protein